MTNENTSVPETTNPSAHEAVGTQATPPTVTVNTPTVTLDQKPAEDFLQTTETVKKGTVSGEEKAISALGYLPFTVFTPILLKKDSEFCKTHAKQSIVLAALFGGMFFIFSFMGAFRIWVFLYMVFAAWGAFTAFSGMPAKMPMVSEVAKKIKL